MAKVIIFGASGIIGQTMRTCVPRGIEPIWVRRKSDLLHVGIDCSNIEGALQFVAKERPEAVINLAGESDTDIVEKNPDKYRTVNVEFPDRLAQYCQRFGIHYVHVSSQAVFDGAAGQYKPESPRRAVNEYGKQKLEAEQRIAWHASSGWTIVRPTTVLGVRPMPAIGRKNPAEAMLSGAQRNQVDDRFFSIVFARDIAMTLWNALNMGPQMRAIHAGVSPRMSRYTIAKALECDVDAVPSELFAELAPRPVDTTYAETPDNPMRWSHGDWPLLRAEWEDREQDGPLQRARELAIFLGRDEHDCIEWMNRGFSVLHNDVTADFRKFKPKNDDELLDWYRWTEAYLWELSAYHCDPGFNYAGMCKGIADRMLAGGVKNVLVLGDGIGTMTMAFRRTGIEAWYHDLLGSNTAMFADARFYMHGLNGYAMYSMDWNPPTPIAGYASESGAPTLAKGHFDAVCASDFLEHVPNVRTWVDFIRHVLKPGGLFFAQNAFACGSGDDGPMPMHLACNDHYEKDWDPMLAEIGFNQESSNWYRRAA